MFCRVVVLLSFAVMQLVGAYSFCAPLVRGGHVSSCLTRPPLLSASIRRSMCQSSSPPTVVNTPQSQLATSSPFRTMIICGPSGAGKGTIIARLLQQFPEKLSLSVSHTTRSPRPGEVEGLHYHFVPLDRMRSAIEEQAQPGARRKFIEYAQVHGNYYGTSVKALERIWSRNQLAILDVDTKGVLQIKESRELSARYVFIIPPDMKTLLQRLTDRGTETPEQISTRMTNADKQLALVKDAPEMWDLVLQNGQLDECVETLVGHMKTWFPEYLTPDQCKQ